MSQACSSKRRRNLSIVGMRTLCAYPYNHRTCQSIQPEVARIHQTKYEKLQTQVSLPQLPAIRHIVPSETWVAVTLVLTLPALQDMSGNVVISSSRFPRPEYDMLRSLKIRVRIKIGQFVEFIWRGTGGERHRTANQVLRRHIS